MNPTIARGTLHFERRPEAQRNNDQPDIENAPKLPTGFHYAATHCSTLPQIYSAQLFLRMGGEN